MDRGLEDGAVGIGPALIPLPHPRYRKAFDVEPSLHSGINAAVLLIAAGQRFEDSEELRLIGASRPCAPRPTSRPQRDRGRVWGERTPGWGWGWGWPWPLSDLFCLNPHLDRQTCPGPSRALEATGVPTPTPMFLGHRVRHTLVPQLELLLPPESHTKVFIYIFFF